MACGAPVVTSNASSLPEVAGNAALQISPNDEAAWTRALLRLVRDEDLGDRLRAAGFEQAERFRWADSARQLLEIYARMLEEASA
jgi:glycosyltransferase involved in cell wall biosynthesis